MAQAESRPKFQVLDDLPDEEYEALKSDIAENGLKYPIQVDREGNVLDGHQRQRVCCELEIEPHRFIQTDLQTDREKRLFARRLNLNRRHITDQQKRKLVADEYRERWADGEDPSSRDVADALHVSNKLAWEVQLELNAQGEKPECRTVSEKQCDTVIGRDGIERPANVISATVQRARVEEAVAANPNASLREIADKTGASKDTVSRVKKNQAPVYVITNKEMVKASKLLSDDRLDLGTNRVVTIDMVVKEARNTAREARDRSRPMPSLPEGKFNLVLADPPWRYDFSIDEKDDIENHYSTMSLEDIAALPVSEFVADDCILFLWGTSPKLLEALHVMAAWGFTYKTSGIWHKSGKGMGYYWPIDHEFLLIGTRGTPGVPLPADQPASSVVDWPKGKHSEKPAIFHENLEKMYPNAVRIEMFCRQEREGWTAWGNEVST